MGSMGVTTLEHCSTDTDEIFYGREALLVLNKNMQKKLLIYSTSNFDPPATGLLIKNVLINFLLQSNSYSLIIQMWDQS